MTCTENQIVVPCLTLSEFIRREEIADPLFIKMDVEGAEALILKDTSLFQERKPDIYVSTHKIWWNEGNWDVDAAVKTVKHLGSIYKFVYGWNRGMFYPVDLTGDFADVVFTDVVFTDVVFTDTEIAT